MIETGRRKPIRPQVHRPARRQTIPENREAIGRRTAPGLPQNRTGPCQAWECSREWCFKVQIRTFDPEDDDHEDASPQAKRAWYLGEWTRLTELRGEEGCERLTPVEERTGHRDRITGQHEDGEGLTQGPGHSQGDRGKQAGERLAHHDLADDIQVGDSERNSRIRLSSPETLRNVSAAVLAINGRIMMARIIPAMSRHSPVRRPEPPSRRSLPG